MNTGGWNTSDTPTNRPEWSQTLEMSKISKSPERDQQHGHIDKPEGGGEGKRGGGI